MLFHTTLGKHNPIMDHFFQILQKPILYSVHDILNPVEQTGCLTKLLQYFRTPFYIPHMFGSSLCKMLLELFLGQILLQIQRVEWLLIVQMKYF